MNALDRFLTRILMLICGSYAFIRAFAHADLLLGLFGLLLLFVATIGSGWLPRPEDAPAPPPLPGPEEPKRRGLFGPKK